MHLNNGYPRITLKTSAGLYACIIDGVLFCSDNAWHHIVAVVNTSTSHYTGNGGHIWIDGADVLTINYLYRTYDSSSDNWSIGARAAGVESFFDGLIDEVAIYNRAFLPEEIEQLYTSGLAGYGYVDPLLADPGNDDYHLKSQAGRWDPDGETWVTDVINSPCIDASDPNSDWMTEPWPNGNRLNMGAYGNTSEASRSCTTIDDLYLLAGDWQENESIMDIAPFPDGDGVINLFDFVLLGEYWLECAGW
jgi:hypothetical protein